jgi:hypothetical protein
MNKLLLGVAGAVGAVALPLAFMSGTLTANASNPPGNNGTIKVDGEASTMHPTTSRTSIALSRSTSTASTRVTSMPM